MTVPPCMMKSAGRSYAAALKEMGTCTSQGAFLQQPFRRWATAERDRLSYRAAKPTAAP